MTTTSHDEMTTGCKQAAIDTRQQSIQDVEKQSGRMVRPRMPPESRATCREVGARRLAKPTLDLDTFALHLTSFARFLCLQHTCSLLSLFCFILSIAPTFCCFLYLFALSRLRFPACSCLFPKHAQRPAPAFSTFQLAAAPDYAADTHRERLC
jgi:hypothetical protein